MSFNKKDLIITTYNWVEKILRVWQQCVTVLPKWKRCIIKYNKPVLASHRGHGLERLQGVWERLVQTDGNHAERSGRKVPRWSLWEAGKFLRRVFYSPVSTRTEPKPPTVLQQDFIEIHLSAAGGFRAARVCRPFSLVIEILN